MRCQVIVCVCGWRGRTSSNTNAHSFVNRFSKSPDLKNNLALLKLLAPLHHSKRRVIKLCKPPFPDSFALLETVSMGIMKSSGFYVYPQTLQKAYFHETRFIGTNNPFRLDICPDGLICVQPISGTRKQRSKHFRSSSQEIVVFSVRKSSVRWVLVRKKWLKPICVLFRFVWFWNVRSCGLFSVKRNWFGMFGFLDSACLVSLIRHVWLLRFGMFGFELQDFKRQWLIDLFSHDPWY